MVKGRPVKQWHTDHYNGNNFFDSFEEIINEKDRQGWEFVRIYSLRANEYVLLYKKKGGKDVHVSRT